MSSYPQSISSLYPEGINRNSNKGDNIEDAWGFSSKTSIALSRGFSNETLTGV